MLGDVLSFGISASIREHTLGEDAANFAVGFGDAASFGITGMIRETDLYGGDCFTDKDSWAYAAGEWGSTVAWSLMGLGAGFQQATARQLAYQTLGSELSGLERSHWIPSRYFRQLGLGWLDKETVWNINYVSKYEHYLHDPHRRLKNLTQEGKYKYFRAQLSRLPLPYRGLLIGVGVGVLGAYLNE